MLSFTKAFNLVIMLLFTLCYLYQLIYVLISAFAKPRSFTAKAQCKYAVIIAARNEAAVISQLIHSILRQTYPAELIDIFVVADNCTDDTARIAREAGAHVFVRNDTAHIGKGYALNFAFRRIAEDFPQAGYDGFFVFDADNILEETYIAEMNSVFSNGYRVVTSYRNSKNYDTNWISAGSSLWFMKEARFLNNARMIIGTSCAVSGTGFLVHRDIIEKNRGWKHHLMTEDIEFSIDCVINGEVIGYCDSAILYDEQPIVFEQSWRQRLRWAKGFYQVAAHYGVRLVRGIFGRKCLSCFDMLMTVLPAMGVSVLGMIVNLVVMAIEIIDPGTSMAVVRLTAGSLVSTVLSFYLLLYFYGLITTISEWQRIHSTPIRKILYTFTFPLFILTYVPIAVVALFKKIEWTPITHSISKTVEEIRR